MALALVEFDKFEGLFKSMEKQLVMQTSFLESMYMLESEKIRDAARDTQLSSTKRQEELEAVFNPRQAKQAVTDTIENDNSILTGMALAVGEMFTSILGGLSFSNIGSVLLKGGLIVALAPVIGDFVESFVSQGLKNLTDSGFPIPESFHAGIAETMGDAAKWGTIGKIIGGRLGAFVGVGGFAYERINEFLDPNKNGEIESGFLEGFNPETVSAVGGAIAGGLALALPSLIGKGMAALLGRAAVQAAATAAVSSVVLGGAGAAAGVGLAGAAATAGLIAVIVGGVGFLAYKAWKTLQDSKEFNAYIDEQVDVLTKDRFKLGQVKTSANDEANTNGATIGTEENAGLTQTYKESNVLRETTSNLARSGIKVEEATPQQLDRASREAITTLSDDKMNLLTTMTPDMVANNFADANSLGEGMNAEGEQQVRAYLDFMKARGDKGDILAKANYERMIEIFNKIKSEASPEELIDAGDGYAILGKIIRDYTSVSPVSQTVSPKAGAKVGLVEGAIGSGRGGTTIAPVTVTGGTSVTRGGDVYNNYTTNVSPAVLLDRPHFLM